MKWKLTEGSKPSSFVFSVVESKGITCSVKLLFIYQPVSGYDRSETVSESREYKGHK